MNAFVAAYSSTPADLVICNITSNAAHEPIESAALYGGPKAALELVTRTIAQEAVAHEHAPPEGLLHRPRQHGHRHAGLSPQLRPHRMGALRLVRQRYEAGEIVSPQR